MSAKLVFNGAKKIHGAIHTISTTDLERKRSCRESGIINIYTEGIRSKEDIKLRSEERRLLLQKNAPEKIKKSTGQSIINHIWHGLENMLDRQNHALELPDLVIPENN